MLSEGNRLIRGSRSELTESIMKVKSLERASDASAINNATESYGLQEQPTKKKNKSFYM